MNSESVIFFKADRAEEARLVTNYLWPFGASQRRETIWSLPSTHRRFEWAQEKLHTVHLRPRKHPDERIFPPYRDAPRIPPSFREIIYYNGEVGRPEGVYYDDHKRRFFVDKRRRDIDELRAKYHTPEAVEKFFRTEEQANKNMQRLERFRAMKIPERLLKNSYLIPDFDAEVIAGRKVNKKKLIHDAFNDMRSIGYFQSSITLPEKHRQIQFEIASHGINCAVTTVRDVLYQISE